MPSAPVVVTVRYWASARAAAGVDQDEVAGGTVAEVVRAVTARRPGLSRIVGSATILVDGRVATGTDAVGEACVLEILPPFAGG